MTRLEFYDPAEYEPDGPLPNFMTSWLNGEIEPAEPVTITKEMIESISQWGHHSPYWTSSSDSTNDFKVTGFPQPFRISGS
jgi:hypothetical protein